MTRGLQAAVSQHDGVTFVKLIGVIDEDNNLGGLTERIPAGDVVLNLAEIERINSCGVRDWVNWLTGLSSKGAKIVLAECAPAIVSQLNLVGNFAGDSAVQSFFAPYYCQECKREKVILIEARELPEPARAPTCRCDECDGAMSFDDLEDSYFAFLEQIRRTAPPTADAPLDQASNAWTGPLSKSASSSIPSIPVAASRPSGARPAIDLVGEAKATQSGSRSGALVYVLIAILIAFLGLLLLIVNKSTSTG